MALSSLESHLSYDERCRLVSVASDKWTHRWDVKATECTSECSRTSYNAYTLHAFCQQSYHPDGCRFRHMLAKDVDLRHTFMGYAAAWIFAIHSVILPLPRSAPQPLSDATHRPSARPSTSLCGCGRAWRTSTGGRIDERSDLATGTNSVWFSSWNARWRRKDRCCCGSCAWAANVAVLSRSAAKSAGIKGRIE